MTTAKPYIGDIDISNIKLSQAYKTGSANREQRVDISLENGGKFIVQLCEDWQNPMQAKYPLDPIRDDADKADRERRGQMVLIENSGLKEKFKELDNLIMKTAMTNQREWFGSKTEVPESTIRDRYVHTLKAMDDGSYAVKFKVKCEPAQYPTSIHRVNENGKVETNKGFTADLERRGAKIAPIVSSFGIWFMGSRFGLSLQCEEMIVTPGPEPDRLSNFSTKRPYEMEQSVDGAFFDRAYKGLKVDTTPPVKGGTTDCTVVKLENNDEVST